MIERSNPSLEGFDDAVLERWGLKPIAKDTLTRAKERGAITPQEISEMISNALAKDRQKMAEVLRELKQTLQNLNISVTFNVVHTHTIVQSPPPTVTPAQIPVIKPDQKAKKPPGAGEGHGSPFLNAKILSEQGLAPEALGVLSAAQAKGYVSPQEIGAIIPRAISDDRERLRATMRWITQLLSAINVRIVIGSVHVKKPDSTSPEMSYSVRPERAVSPRGKLPVLFDTNGTEAQPSREALAEIETDEELEKELSGDEENENEGEFIPKFVFDREDGVSNPYYRAVKNHKFLKHEQLLELSRRWHMHKDYDARNEIVVHNLRLALKIAAHYMGRGLDYDDLVQEGNLGLIRAADRFNPELGYHFTTYATWWVRQSICRAIANFKNIIRMPVHAHEALNKTLKITCELGMELQREPTLEEVAARMGEDIDKVKKILHQLRIPVISLEELAYGASSKATIGDITTDIGFPTPSTALEAKEDLEIAAKNIRTLLAAVKALDMSERAKTAFKMYYGLEGHREDHTLESVARTSGYGVTREWIRQLNNQVWQKLAEHGIAMDDEKLVAALKRVHDLENIVCAEADLATPEEALILEEVSIVFHDEIERSGGELIPGVTISPKRLKANLEKAGPLQPPSGTPTQEDIIRVVAGIYGTTSEAILGESRPKEIVWVRWICTYLMREELKSSFVEIGMALCYADHTTVIHGYKSIVKAIERDPSVKEEVEKIATLCGFRKQDQVPSIETAGSSARQAFSPVIEHVLCLSCQAFGVDRTSLFQKFVRSIKPEVIRAKFARDITMYLLHADIGVQCQEVAQMFNFRERSNISVICGDIERRSETDTDLGTKLALIRGQYTLEPYGSDLELLKKCQKRLFPKQVEELTAMSEKAQQQFQEKIRELHDKVDYIDLSQRHKDCFKARYGGDVSKEMSTYESLAKPLGITRARIEQIINATWKQLNSILEPMDIRSSGQYVKELEKVRLLVELLKR